MPEEIVPKLRQVEVLMGTRHGSVWMRSDISELSNKSITAVASSMGGMGVEQLKEFKRLQKENDRQRKTVSDLTLDKLILK